MYTLEHLKLLTLDNFDDQSSKVVTYLSLLDSKQAMFLIQAYVPEPHRYIVTFLTVTLHKLRGLV